MWTVVYTLLSRADTERQANASVDAWKEYMDLACSIHTKWQHWR